VLRWVLAIAAASLLAGAFVVGVTKFKFDQDPTNDAKGKCVLVASAAVSAAILLHRLHNAHPLSCSSLATCRSGLLLRSQFALRLRPARRSRSPAFERMVCTGL
jgi:hypothetical protein